MTIARLGLNLSFYVCGGAVMPIARLGLTVKVIGQRSVSARVGVVSP